MDKNTFIDKFVDDGHSLGIRPGGVLMVHSALKPFGHVPGGAETIIRALLTTLGENGTLLMPALSYEHVLPQTPIFDVVETPSNVGIIAETFRQRPGTRRSMHPTHSVCAAGRMAESLLAAHSMDSSPCGPNSPFHMLPHHQGQILMLGCGLNPNTSMHAIEEIIEPPYLFDPPLTYTLIDEHQQAVQKNYRPHNFRGWGQRYDRVQNLLHPTDWRRGTIAGADADLIEAGALWPAALEALSAEPLYFVEVA